MTAPMDDGEVSLTIGRMQISGWTDVRITRSCESCPSTFDIGMTDLFPGQAEAIVARAGDPCVVKIGADTVVTGYVDAVEPEYDADSHSIRVTGRGKCQDLVDCSADPSNTKGQFKNLNVLQIAQILAKPYGITVSGEGGKVIPQFNLMMTETPYEIIERICRFAALLCYEGTDGNLILSILDPTSAASGAVEGQNVLRCRARYSMNERFSEYDVYLQDLDVWQDIGDTGNQVFTARDPNVPRFRKKVLICEDGAAGQALAKPRAIWEMARRWGRSWQLTPTVDSWRDVAGMLWAPNTTIPIDLPTVKVPNIKGSWVVGDVTYLRDAHQGTRAEMLIMPAAAFLPEPVLLQPFIPDIPAQ